MMKPLKILHTSDWHLGKMLGRFSRLSEQEEFLKELQQIIQEKSPHILIISGDIFDNYNPPIEALELFFQYTKLFSENGKRIVAIIAGNHDSPDRLNAPQPLALEHGILFAGYPETEFTSFELSSKISVNVVTSSVLEIRFPDLDFPVNLIFTAYANESRLNGFIQPNETREFSKILEDYWKKKLKQVSKHSINILMAHAFVAQRGETLPEESEDEKSILSVGGAEIIYTDQFPKKLHYVALGHLHKFQVMNDFVVYSGSPLSYSFKEAEQKKYVVYAELLPNVLPHIQPIQIQAGIPLVKKTFKNVEHALAWLKENSNVYSEIYLELDEFLKSEDHRRLREYNRVVQIVPVLKSTSSNSHWRNSIDLNLTVEELFIRYFEFETGQKPNSEIINEFREIQNVEL
ncbi:MAG: exonuclease subunit SbcD [Leptospiraceae bacterium]|nr:exonuclease subunit SbcD [Leptospiraceae bacterium]